MELSNLLMQHAAIVVVASPLIGLDGLCIVGGMAAAVGLQSPITMLLLAFQGQMLSEMLCLTTERRWYAGLVFGARWSRRLGITRAALDGGVAFRRWLLTIYCMVGAVALASLFIGGGLLVGVVLGDVGGDVASCGLSFVAIASAVALRMLGRERRT